MINSALASHAIALYRAERHVALPRLPAVPTPVPDPELVASLAAVDTSVATLARYHWMTPQQRREVLLALYVRDGKAQQEIAQLLDVHPSTVSRQLERAGLLKDQRGRVSKKRPVQAGVRMTARERTAITAVSEILAPLDRVSRKRVLKWAREVLAANATVAAR